MEKVYDYDIQTSITQSLRAKGFGIFSALPDAILTFPFLSGYMCERGSTVFVSIWTDYSGIGPEPEEEPLMLCRATPFSAIF
jgi:hypothetical protein